MDQLTVDVCEFDFPIFGIVIFAVAHCLVTSILDLSLY